MNALAALKVLKTMHQFTTERATLIERQGGPVPHWKRANLSALKIAIDLMEGRLDEASFKMGFDAGVKHQRERSLTLKQTTAELARLSGAFERYRSRITKLWARTTREIARLRASSGHAAEVVTSPDFGDPH